MKLLVVTQTVNTNDPVLGFFHHWLEEFAKRFEHIHVVCLFEGVHTLPKNVSVHSLGKEKGGNRLLYSFRFLQYVVKLRREYDAVFVHMNPEYIALAGDFWRFTGKRVGLWYNHAVGSIWLKLAQPFVHVIFHTSPYAYPARYKNAQLMPAGIDTELFSPKELERTPYSMYFQGRIASAKRVHVLLEAVRILRKEGIPAVATLVGPEDVSYGETLRKDFADIVTEGVVDFVGPRRNEETPALYATHEVAINLTADGNFDKTVLEAGATETPVIVSSKAFAGVVPSAWVVKEDDAHALASKLKEFFALSADAKRVLGKELRTAVISSHSLSVLGKELERSFPAL